MQCQRINTTVCNFLASIKVIGSDKLWKNIDYAWNNLQLVLDLLRQNVSLFKTSRRVSNLLFQISLY